MDMIRPKLSGNLFPPNIRKALIAAAILGGLLCLTLVRYSHDGTWRIASLYATVACIMALIVIYKNSLNKYEIAIFCFLCIQLFASVPIPGDFGDPTAYVLSYRYGVSSRGFIATIVDFLTAGDFISRYFVWHFILSNTVFLLFTMSAYIGNVIEKSKDDTKYFLIFLSFLWLSCFTAPSAYFYNNFDRTEIFALIISFLAMAIVRKPVIRWLMPLLTLAIIATHIIQVFFYIPFVAILLFYGIIEKDRRGKRSMLLLGTTVALLLIAFLCYVMFARGTFAFENADDFYNYLSSKTDLNLRPSSLHAFMFADLEDHLAGWKERVGLMYRGNLAILINIPLLFLFMIFWAKCFIKETEKIKRMFFLLPMAVLPYQATVFFLFWDFARWMIMILNVQFLLVFYLAAAKNKTVLAVIQTVTPFIRRYAFFIALMLLIMIYIGPVGYAYPSDRMTRFFHFFTGR